ncbi:MAG: hypothetical protein JSR12_12120 [Bacteroidetes bacterium]|nr:hypothetical protein [Bacteroidota bacterium]
MNNKKVAAFSLLAHINDNNIGIKNFDDIFIPIVKSSLCRLNQNGVKSGQTIIEIKNQIDNTFALDIPIPILKKLLFKISNEVEKNLENQFILHKDNSFLMNDFLFADYENELEEKESEIQEIERLYHTYLNSIRVEINKEVSIFEYIDQNRINLSRFFAYQENKQLEVEFVHQANFINSVKINKRIYNTLRRIYLGSLIAAYLEVEIGETNNKIEILIDTNFILGILDLNSSESTHTCRKIIEICDKLGFSKSVLPFTIEETQMLIERKANQIETAFFQGYLDPESIYNASKRRNLSKTQLFRISNSLEDVLEKEYKIYKVANDTKFRTLAKYQYSSVLEFYQNIRGNYNFSALHDTTAIAYVREKRGGTQQKGGDIMKANCWFVTNTPFNIKTPNAAENLPEIIRAEELLNFLWLSNPNVTQFLNSSEISSLGLTRLVSSTISYSLPNPKVLRELDENFNTYGESNISADDTVMIASMIAKKRIVNPEVLNKIATSNSSHFISEVKSYAERGRQEEKEMTDKLVKVLDKLELVIQKQQADKKEEKNLATQKVEKEIVEVVNPIDKNLIRQNRILKNSIVVIVLSLVSSFVWTIEKFITIPIIPNIIIIKALIQFMLITIIFGIYKKSTRTAWISTTVAFLIAIFMLLKK